MNPTPKLPPHNIEAEQAVIGGIMLDNRAFSDAAELLSEDDFYRADHRIIWGAIVSLCGAGKPADFVTVTGALRSRGDLEDAGGLVYVGQLANDVPASANVLHYAHIVQQQAILRQIIAIGARAAQLGFNTDGLSVEEVLSEVERGVFQIRERGARAKNGALDLSHLVEMAERGIELRMKSDGGITGLRTGIADLDSKTTGLHPGDLVIVAGRPSQGKTSLAMNIAESCAIDQGKWAAVFSMEMPGEQLALRVMASRNRVPLQGLRSGQLDRAQWAKLSAGNGVLREAKMVVDETGALSPNELRARARRIANRCPLGLIVVDYIQLMQIPGSKENRTNEVSEISRCLKALAKELRVPIVALSQLNRGVESRDNKRPRMSDLRESGGIEQDADLILFIYRDEVYNANSPDAGTAEIIIGKQRNGPLGMVRSAFTGDFCRFDDLAQGWRPTAIEDQPKPARSRGFGRAMSHAAHSVGYDA